MKIEKLSKGKSKLIILPLLMIALIIGIIYITNSRAKYQVTKNVQIVNGNVNYSLADLNVLALQVQSAEESKIYNSVDIVPIGRYKINTEKSYCKYSGDNAEHRDIPMEYKDGKISISISKKGTKCYVYLDFERPASEKTLTQLGLEVQEGTPDFSKAACDSGCENTDKGLYKTQDDDGESYYFRGSVTDNWVKFAGYYWRIIRINGDGTIRLIYSGKTNEENLTFPSTNKTNPAYVTGTGTQVTIDGSNTTTFNTSVNRNRYVGYMYGNSYSNYNESHKNETSSNIKSKLESWYTSDLANVSVGGKTAKDYIDTDAGFCGDRTPYNGSSSSSSIDYSYGGSTTTTYYGGYFRLVAQKTPDLHCKRKTGSGSTTLLDTNDLYTVGTSSKGNKALSSPVGLISADEVTFAGGKYGANNQGYYLYTNSNYWTLSPYRFGSGNAAVFFVDSSGYLNDANVDNSFGVRPVINLKADTKFTFTHPDQPTKGTFSNSYEVS